MKFLENIKKYKNNTALITEQRKIITYNKLNIFVKKFSKNFKKRSLAFIISNNDLETIVAYLSFIGKNCVVMLIDQKTNEETISDLVENYCPEYIFLNQKKTIRINDYFLADKFFNYTLLKSKNKKKYKMIDELALLMPTSGSTGSQKYVMLSYENLNFNTKCIINSLKIKKKDITITTLPMSYVYGLSIINTHLVQGSSIVLNTKSVMEKDFWKSIENNNVNNFGGVPYIYQILSKMNLFKFNLKSLKYTTQAGGKLNLDILKNILKNYKKMNVKLFCMYGASEATARMSILDWKFINKKIGSVGKALKGTKFNIEKKTNEIIFSGKNVFLGYAENISDLNKSYNNNILKTGDIGHLDKDNFLYITGRKDRYVKIYGMRISLEELEDRIFKLGEENVCSAPKENMINVYIKSKRNFKELIKKISSYTKIHASCFNIIKVSEFPLNKNLKISYKSLTR